MNKFPITITGSREWPMIDQELSCRSSGASRKMNVYFKMTYIFAYFKNYENVVNWKFV
jgi:hypothetical protein